MNQVAKKRAAVTLIELLVIIGIIAVLFAIGVRFLSNVQYQQRASRGASMLQGWLNSARQKALLYRKPYGLRLLPGQAMPALITDCQFIEEPEIFSGGTIVSSPPNSNTTFSISGVTFQGLTTVLVQVGDYLELESGLPRRISGVSTSPTFQIQIASSLPYAIPNPISSYKIIRQPRPTGDEVLQLPTDIVIDTSVVAGFASSFPNGQLPAMGPNGLDIMFSPSGAVLHTANNAEYFPLWVRDVTGSNMYSLEPSLIGVFVRTGVVAAHPVNETGNPYAFLEDGRSSGLGK